MINDKNVTPQKIIAGTLLGTSAMTAFSYMISEKAHRQFREPVLLNQFLDRSGLSTDQRSSKGWILHYATGALFVTAYHKLWRIGRLQPSLTTSAALGAVSGLIGIGVWKSLYHFHPHPPRTHEEKYYKQLLVAHVIFGVFAAIGYRLIKK